MFFSTSLTARIHSRFEEIKPVICNYLSDIYEKLEKCDENERLIIEYFYGFMPASDVGDYDFDFFKKFAQFGLFLADNCKWCEEIPAEIFLDYVVFYRVNNESIDDCRSLFYNELKDRINGKNMYNAALEVNLWCAEHVTYRSTDIRTVSPLTAYKSSYGRCGEESTFVVTAMRSVGIPARQVYTPKWSHCDDNHAWVEVWCDGKWYYLGACEPEPVLNRGWFVEAAARAMLVNCISYLPHHDEEIIEKSAGKIMLNQLARYAPTVKITVCVQYLGSPVSGANVIFELLNESEFSSIAKLITDADGKVKITLGRGSILIRAAKYGFTTEKLINTSKEVNITLEVAPLEYQKELSCEDFLFKAPDDFPLSTVLLTEEQRKTKHTQVEKCEELRKKYIDGFYNSEKAQKAAIRYSNIKLAIDILKAAEGNFSEIYDFMCTDFGDENREFQLDMLSSLSVKDYRDVSSKVLSEHFAVSLKHKDCFPRDIFVSYVLCPRVSFENLTPYAKEVLSEIGDKADELIKNPRLILEYVSNFSLSAQYEDNRLVGTPLGILRSKISNEEGRKILFVSMCRVLGIPSRIDIISGKVQLWENGRFIFLESNFQSLSTLILHGGSDKWSYKHNWSLSVLENGEYRTLDLSKCIWSEDRLEIKLPGGFYRIITTTRLPNGNQYAKKYSFSLENDKTTEFKIELNKIQINDLLVNIRFNSFNVFTEDNKPISVFEISKNKTNVIIWIEEGREPTEHILNELIELKDAFNKLDCYIVMLVQSKSAFENKTFAAACSLLEKSKVYITDFSETASVMARRMYVNSDNLPLTVVLNGDTGIFACSGYNVGTADLLLQIITSIGNCN